MAETEDSQRHWQSEIGRLTELRDDAAKVDNALAYTAELMSRIEEGLPHIDQTPDQLKALPADQRDRVLRERRDIVRALCEKVIIWSNGQVKLVGVIDGSEGAQFDLPSLKIGLTEPYDLTQGYGIIVILVVLLRRRVCPPSVGPELIEVGFRIRQQLLPCLLKLRLSGPCAGSMDQLLNGGLELVL